MTSETSLPPLNDLQHTHWRALQYLNLYRMFLAILLTSLNIFSITPSPLGIHNIFLLQYCTAFYLAYSLFNVHTISVQSPDFNIQLYFQVLADIILITLMMHASGGASSGLGTLLIVTVAGGSLLSGGRTAVFFAATATLAVLLEGTYAFLEGATSNSTQEGLLGATFFVTALLGHTLAKRLHASEALAEKRGIDLANMAQLTEYIIQRMQTGIIVLDDDNNIRLMNESAQHLLGADQTEAEGFTTLPIEFIEQFNHWKTDNSYSPSMLKLATTGANILPRFAALGEDDRAGTIIFIEDTAAMAQQAQQLKLVSLGRLTASIAHEIRNPLGAISHANQLLSEASYLNNEDQRLIEIISTHASRVNTIIENIMQLSRRQPTHTEELALGPWVSGFSADFCHDYHIEADMLTMEIADESLVVRFDNSQLRQVVDNLCQNSLRYFNSGTANGPCLRLIADINRDTNRPYIDIIDNGPGVKDEDIAKLFEPFFTKTSNGTGLGLYIARELCESNQAQLDYIKRTQGACFRISFADPRRAQVLSL